MVGTSWEDQPVKVLEDRWTRFGPGVKRFSLPGNEPVRRIITGRRNGRVGALYSWKNGRHVVHESTGEERLARLFEVHPSVTAYFGQPETIRFASTASRKPIRYTPDFLVLFGNSQLRVEYKRLIDIRPPAPKPGDERAQHYFDRAAGIREKLRMVRDAYRRCGVAWKLLTDVDLASMADRETVDDVIANAGRPIAEANLQRLVDRLRSSPGRSTTMRQCEDALVDVEFARGDVLARIPEGIIEIDLLAPINESTVVRLVRSVR